LDVNAALCGHSQDGSADLVLEIQEASTLGVSGAATVSHTQVRLRILDARPHFVLWTLAEPVEGAMRKATWEKNLDQTIGKLIR
jgi:hypothetical protein